MEAKNLGPDSACHTRLLNPPDIAAVQSLFERASDYFELATGVPPGRDEATRAFVAGPPTKSVDDKRIIGAFDGQDGLIGVIDALVDFPGEGDWTMGLLLLDPAQRGVGLGSALLREYEAWAAAQGAARFHTALVSNHDRGIRFLEARGYARKRSVDDYDAGGQTATVLFFSKDR
jgi:GNAT superfamily N-acetyltransferase